jgi:hypothetical protein
MKNGMGGVHAHFSPFRRSRWSISLPRIKAKSQLRSEASPDGRCLIAFSHWGQQTRARWRTIGNLYSSYYHDFAPRQRSTGRRNSRRSYSGGFRAAFQLRVQARENLPILEGGFGHEVKRHQHTSGQPDIIIIVTQ